MKIMHIVEGFGGGVYSFLVDLCNSLANSDEIIIVYNKREQTPDTFLNEFSSKIKMINLPMKREVNIISDINAIIKINKILKNEKPDIIHLHSSKAGVLGRLSSKICGYKSKQVLYNPHGYAFLQENISRKKRIFYFVIEKIMAQIQGINIAVSKGEYEESLKLTKKCMRIDNAINSNDLDKLIKSKSLNKEITIGTIGRIMYQKNPTIFNEIAKEFPHIKFIWIGDGDLRSELTAPNIKITGWKNRSEAIGLMNDIDIYIQTSRWEGLPIALLEGMYMKKAVIVSNVIGNKDVVENGVNGFIANNLEEYKKYINSLLEDERLFKEISDRAREYIVKNHLINDMLIKYRELYNLVIQVDMSDKNLKNIFS